MNFEKISFIPKSIKQKLESRDGIKKMASNFIWLFFDKILRMLVWLVVIKLMVPYLGVEKYGYWSYAIAFVSFFTPLSTLGLNTIVVKEIVKSPQNKYEIIGTTFFLKLCGSILLVLSSVGVIFLVRPDDIFTQYLVFIVALQYVFLSTDTIDLFFQSQLKSKLTVIAKNSAFLAVSASKIWLIYIEAKLEWFVWVSTLEMLIGAIVLTLIYQLNKNSIKKWKVRLETIKFLLKDSWPLIISSASIMMQGYIDQVMLGDMINETELGYYSAALKLIILVSFIPMIIQSTVAPEITKAKQVSEKLYYFKLKRVYQIMFLSFIAIGLPLLLMARFIIGFLYEENFSPSAIILQFLVIRLFFTNFGVGRTLFLTNNNLFKYALITSFAGLVINILLNYFLIPEYKSTGAIVATIISFSVTIFIIDFIYPKTRRNFKTMMLAIINIKGYTDLLKNSKS